MKSPVSDRVILHLPRLLPSVMLPAFDKPQHIACHRWSGRVPTFDLPVEPWRAQRSHPTLNVVLLSVRCKLQCKGPHERITGAIANILNGAESLAEVYVAASRTCVLSTRTGLVQVVHGT